jgi:hypothetical protein
MRNLPLLLVLLLLSVLLSAASAQASLLPVPTPVQPFVAIDEEEAEEDEAAEAEDEEEEFCTFEEEEEELCEEEEEFAPKDDKGDECLLKSANASITANPGKRRLRLTVHYKTLKPAAVNVEASLQGPKGAVRLGIDHARFRRSGVYRDTFSLAEKQAKKALVAREFSVELHVVNSPSSCDIELTGASRRARR